MRKEWFAGWFDSPYYHILYQNHNEQDAQNFINALVNHLTPQYLKQNPEIATHPNPQSQIRILDLACGKGRHSRYMASKGFDVTGTDLSTQSIEFARQSETDNLTFYQHDMRKSFRINYFDFIFNFFTSFGYFDKDEDNILALKKVHEGLKENGIFVLDYFNSEWVKSTLKTDYIQKAGGIDFHIKKRIEDGHVIKTIKFLASGVEYKFQEKVRLFSLKDFEHLFAASGLKIIEKFGDYELNAFDKKTSKRLIIKAVAADSSAD
jgi:SAM-dependent methyltransferase